jgi:protocatechuate 3,4-dioxygenase beta subunit
MPGRRIVIEGSVLTTDCRPISRALVDFWQADDRGEYDNAGYRLRGHQFTDDAGRYRLETIVPGHYPGRTRHLHVKVQAPNGPVLTTQLYFPDEPANQRDGIFTPELVMKVRDVDAGKLATFDFVLQSSAGKT